VGGRKCLKRSLDALEKHGLFSKERLDYFWFHPDNQDLHSGRQTGGLALRSRVEPVGNKYGNPFGIGRNSGLIEK
jgi:hypothetical protein